MNGHMLCGIIMEGQMNLVRMHMIDEGELMETKTTAEIEREEELQAISKLRLLDDDLMKLVFDKNIEATEFLLNIILQREDLKVLEAVAQREYKNAMAQGRSIIIDIYAVDNEGKVYDIEIQRASKGADVHRARFHSSMIDTRMLKERRTFKELHDFKCTSSIDMFYPVLADQMRYFNYPNFMKIQTYFSNMRCTKRFS